MKNFKGLSLVIALVLAVQCLFLGAFATEGEVPPTEAVTEVSSEAVSETTADPTEPPTGEVTGETTPNATEESTSDATEETTEAAAGETEAATEDATELPTEPPTEAPTVDPDAIPDVPEGMNPSVDFGYHTMDAQLPLAGTDALLRSAKGVFVYETQSDTVLYGYNPDKALAPGGLVQILNALVVIENCDLDEVVTVSTQYINQLVPIGVRHQSLKNEEQITVRDLLYCMMLQSANDAAVVLAQHTAGDPSGFITMMNERAAELGCTDTVITTVSGLDSNGQHTTARDMARILKAAMENEEFRTIFGATSYTVPATNRSDARELITLNYQMDDTVIGSFYDKRVTGGKASYTSAKAGAAIGFTAENDDLSLICIILGATRKYADDGSMARYGNFEEAKDLMKHCFDNYRFGRMLYRGQAILQMQVEGGVNDVVAVNKTDLNIVLPKDAGIDDLRMEYEIPGGVLTAPLEVDQQITQLRLWYRGRCVGETTLYAQNAVASVDDPGFTIQNGASRSDDDFAKFLAYAGLFLLILVGLASLYLGINAARRAAAKKRARRKRRQQRDARMQHRRR